MKIIQYLPYEAASKALSSRGTFCLQSLRHFINIEEKNDGVADNMEMSIDFDEGGSGECLFSAIVSCWSIPDDQESPEYLNEHIKGLLDESWFLDHKKVDYRDSLKNAEEFQTNDLVFCKREKYSPQKEYRFCFKKSSKGSHLETLIFTNKDLSNAFPKYIDRVFVNSLLSDEDYKKLLLPWYGNQSAMSKFSDLDRVFKDQQNVGHSPGSRAASV
jgi:hypothetical protein